MEKRKIYTSIFYLFLFTVFFHGNSYKKSYRRSINRILTNQLSSTLNLNSEHTPTNSEAPQAHETGSNEHNSEGHTETHHGGECEEETLKVGSKMWWIFMGVVLGLTCFAGQCSGLTVGMLSIDKLGLEIQAKNGTDEEKRMSNALLPILKQHHLLLATLLLANAGAMESLPIFLDALVPAWAAIIISTSLVLVFGEVVPQAYCTGPNQLFIATLMIPVVKFLMCITYPITWPISYMLDQLLTHGDNKRYLKKDQKTLIELHDGVGSGNNGLTAEEIKIIKSTIDLRECKVSDERIMVQFSKVFMVSDNEIIGSELLNRIAKKGFTRFPIYNKKDKQNILGFVAVKSLQTALKDTGKMLGSYKINRTKLHIIGKDTNLLEALSLFQENKCNIMMVSDTVKEVKTVKVDNSGKVMNPASRRDAIVDPKARPHLIGLIHLKDIFEEIIKAELLDNDNHVLLPSQGRDMEMNTYKEDMRESKEPEESHILQQRLLVNDL